MRHPGFQGLDTIAWTGSHSVLRGPPQRLPLALRSTMVARPVANSIRRIPPPHSPRLNPTKISRSEACTADTSPGRRGSESAIVRCPDVLVAKILLEPTTTTDGSHASATNQ